MYFKAQHATIRFNEVFRFIWRLYTKTSFILIFFLRHVLPRTTPFRNHMPADVIPKGLLTLLIKIIIDINYYLNDLNYIYTNYDNNVAKSILTYLNKNIFDF